VVLVSRFAIWDRKLFRWMSAFRRCTVPTAGTWKWRHYDYSNSLELHIQRHRVTLHPIRTEYFNDNLAHMLLCFSLYH